MQKLEQHPLSAAFPTMPESEIEALAMDIEKHGQREAGVLLEGMVLDGWHRYLACEKSGAKFKSVEFHGGDPVAFVISRNLHRRHLTAAQRVAAVAECSKWAPAHRPGKGGTSSPVMTNRQIAEAADASEKTVKQVKAGMRVGLGDAIKEGMVSAKDAAAIAKGESPPRPKPKAADPLLQKAYEALQAEFSETKDALAEMTEMAASAEAFKNKEEFKAMQDLRAELRAVKQRRGELMRENAELKKDLAYWKKKAK